VAVGLGDRPGPRPGESEGLRYFVVDDAGFDRLVAEGELLERAEFAGNRYGTPRRPVEDRLARGEPVLLEIVQDVRHELLTLMVVP
jgi:guanylate kinase